MLLVTRNFKDVNLKMKKMKKYLNIKTIAFAIVLIGYISGCGWGENDRGPKASIYKTNEEYFRFVNTWGTTNAPTSLNTNTSRIKIENGDTIYTGRIKLFNGYVLAIEHAPNDYFTDITFGELVKYNESHQSFPKDSMFDRVIDKDPYQEFYVAKDYGFEITKISEDDSLVMEQLNEIIRNGELEKYFDRVK